MSATGAYIAAIAWCVVHTALFLAMRRKLNTERRIFSFHVTAFAIFFLVVCFAGLNGAVPLAAAVGMVSLHGIYNLTFLWLWSGSEGSYSVSILRQLTASTSTGEQLADQFARIGGRKQTGRIQSLLRLRLVSEADGLFYLTTFGRFAAGALKSFRWLANIRTAG